MAGSRRSKTARRPTAPPPWHPLIPQLLDLLHRSIDGDSELHNAVARALLVVGLVCRETRDLVAGSEAVLSYEAARLGMGGCFFHDGVSVDLFGPKAGDEAGFVSRHTNMNPSEQFMTDRHETARVLSTATDREVGKFLRRHDAPDLPNAPKRVRVFVGRTRHVAQILSAAAGSECRVCERRTVVNESGDDEGLEGEYWRCAGGFPTPRCQMPVCCEACAVALQTEMDAAAGVTAEELIGYDAPADLSGPRRVHVALRIAFRRNEMVARRMRSCANLRFLSNAEAMQLRGFTAAMLNCDLALLLVCERAVSLQAFRNRVLPPQFLHWRQNPTIFSAPMARVVKAYEKLTKECPPLTPVCHVLSKPRWLSKLVDAFSVVLNGR